MALKVLPPDVFGDRTRLERFVREVKDASALNHPDTLTVYDPASRMPYRSSSPNMWTA